MNKKKQKNRDEKAVSWIGLEKKGEDFFSSEDEKFPNDSVERGRGVKSRSLEVKSYLRAGNAKMSNSSVKIRLQTPKTALNFGPHSLEIIEDALTMRRSEARVNQCNTKLLESISIGDIAYMSRMIAMGANPNATCRMNHSSACHVAAMYNNNALNHLLRSGAERYRPDKLGRTPLHLAAWAGNAKQIALLLNFPEDLTESVANAMTPEIIEQVKSQSLPVHPLTNTPCELNLQSTTPEAWSDSVEHNCRRIKDMLPRFQAGWTALHVASACAHHHCVQLLLAAGADISAQDLVCRTPLNVAGSAHYMGKKIDVTNFKETIRLLLEAGGKFQSRSTSDVNTPLHTAVELDAEEVVEVLLNRNVSATTWNSQGLTAMHICVKKQNKELLQMLANHEYSDEDPHVATVDAKDQTGSTVLSAAIKQGWLQGACVALGARASITMKDNDGESSIHIAAKSGNIDILQEILNVAKLHSVHSIIDFRNEKGETALFKAISHNKLNVIKLLLDTGADIDIETPYHISVFHEAAKHGHKEVLEYLIEYNSNFTAKKINTNDRSGYTPLVYAVVYNHPECVALLISKGAEANCNVRYVDSISKVNLILTTPLHIAASQNYCEIARMIIDHDSNTVHEINSVDRLPLHEACYHGNREIICLLLHKGADLSGVGQHERWKTKLAPIDMLMNNLSKPTEFIEEIFDSHISSKGMSLQESNCEVSVDFGILVPNKSNIKQMRVIKALVNTGNRYDQNRLLLHPLVQSFLYLKWKSLLPFFYTILALHMFFVLSLNVYAISLFYYKDKKIIMPVFFQCNVWKYIVFVTVCLIAIQEIIFLKIKNTRYLLCLETWLKFWAVTLAVILPQVVTWESNSNQEWARLIASVALLLSWFEMMFLLSRFPNWGFYVMMFGKVANKVFKILLSFVFLVFGFGICFMIQYRAKVPFEGPWAAFVKTMVMMTSEYDYQDTISKESAKKISGSIIILRIIFLAFLIIVSIVLMNLLVGVAVNDVNNLEIIGNMKRLEKQVEFITSLEDIVCHKFILKILPKRFRKIWQTNKRWKNVIVLRPREATCSYCKLLPARIREAIFEQAQLQKKQSDEELGSQIFNMKLDEIHKAIVKKDDSESNKTEKKDNTVDKIFEEIDRMRVDIELIKNCVLTTRRHTIRSKQSSFL